MSRSIRGQYKKCLVKLGECEKREKDLAKQLLSTPDQIYDLDVDPDTYNFESDTKLMDQELLPNTSDPKLGRTVKGFHIIDSGQDDDEFIQREEVHHIKGLNKHLGMISKQEKPWRWRDARIAQLEATAKARGNTIQLLEQRLQATENKIKRVAEGKIDKLDKKKKTRKKSKQKKRKSSKRRRRKSKRKKR